jgi:peroxiredoxin
MKLLFYFLLFIFSIQINAQSSENKLQVGEQAPYFIAYDAEGIEFNSMDILKEKNIVLLFYRGDWCPVCTRYLSNLQDSLQYVYKKNAVVLAVSPDKPEKLENMKNKSGAEFILLQDKDYSTMKAFDVAFNPDEKSKTMYNERLKAELEAENLLPVPATFIIDQSGKIVYKHYDPDYKVRASVKEIIDSLPDH